MYLSYIIIQLNSKVLNAEIRGKYTKIIEEILLAPLSRVSVKIIVFISK